LIFAANLKTNHTRISTNTYIKNLSKHIENNNITSKVMVFPTLMAIDHYTQDNIIIGVQNAYSTVKGSITGEVGLEALSEFNIKSIIIGHSERRALGEKNEFLKEKYDFYKNEGFEIIYCIGESLEIRNKGEKEVFKFLENQISYIDLSYEKLIIAYEPIWAIGTGVSATKADIEGVANKLKTSLKDTPLLYGGSVNENNITDATNIDNINGVLVGSASLNEDTFLKIIQNGEK
jgi:triosephosphate isomerase